MRKAYLLVYSPSLGSREEVKKCLNSLPEIVHWRYDLPQAFYVISEATAETLAKLIHARMGGRGRFIVAEVGENRWGWLPRETWYVLRNKLRMPKS